MSRPSLPPPAYEPVVRNALEEDVSRGDVTTAACVPAERTGIAWVRARQSLVVCGLDVASEVFRQVDPELSFEPLAVDGERVAPGADVARVSGRAASILIGERVALNFLQRLGGVATHTRRYVDALPPGSATRITDTRKTTPGLRTLERHAVRCGGGHNHRADLAAGVLIKDNHLRAAGSVRVAVERARSYAPHASRVGCEVDTLEQLREALSAGADLVLLDNFDDAAVASAVREVGERALVEVSGGVTLERIATLASSGVDVISIGALTHSAPAVDLALDWAEPEAR